MRRVSSSSRVDWKGVVTTKSTGSDFGEKVVARVARGVRVRTLASEIDAGGELGTGGKSNVSRNGVCTVIEWLLYRGVGGGMS